jgi:nucleoside-diphosphate-sugar epimerase
MSPLILVTGATGHIGRHLLPALRAAGYRVRAQYHSAPGPSEEGTEWRAFDFLSDEAIAPLVEGCDGVIHLAAALSDSAQMERLNVALPCALAKAAQAAGARYFGFASSVVVYGSPRHRHVTEDTPTLDLSQPIEKQYFAEPYMRDYARSKVAAEAGLRALALPMVIDLLRPAVVIDQDRLYEAGTWSMARKAIALYRRTQYVFAGDVAAAMVHLLHRGLATATPRIEAYNLCDETSGTFRQLFARAYAHTHDRRFAPTPEMPLVPDFAKDLVRHKTISLRYPFGTLAISNAKLRGTGFALPIGFDGLLRSTMNTPSKAAAAAALAAVVAAAVAAIMAAEL